ncbi:hypothetical protein SAY87_000789 [Trapa incisa]|uniref:Myb-related protein 123 n=1 Tax=Trapa incisa TaxID=236973 RepID=A0AAN7GMQ4_9MYRT|nr:hypothetical protein SAY87_000789 [Trapa incisa]
MESSIRICIPISIFLQEHEEAVTDHNTEIEERVGGQEEKGLPSLGLKMGRAPCCPKEELTRGSWTALEDKILVDYIAAHGEGKWRNISKESGLKRCGKSCRLRWLNYLRPDIKRGNITPDEEDLIIRLHRLLGNRWSLIAGRLPGRTDNEIKNYWNTILRKKLKRQEQSKNERGQDRGSANIQLPLKTTSETTASDASARDASTGPREEREKGYGHIAGKTAGPETSLQYADRTKSSDGSPATAISQEENEWENLKDFFSISELLASDLSESELWKMCHFEGDDMDPQQPLLFSEEQLKSWEEDSYPKFQV